MTPATFWDKTAAIAAAIGVVILLLSGLWNLVDESELKATEDRIESELKATEDRITTAFRESTAQTNAQMEEFRGYVVAHLDGHPTN